jgi:hypothetical protein
MKTKVPNKQLEVIALARFDYVSDHIINAH